MIAIRQRAEVRPLRTVSGGLMDRMSWHGVALGVWGVVGVMIAMGVPAPSGLLAQARSDSAAVAAITTDTGDFAPGHRDFTRYTDPDWCLIATDQTQGVLLGTLAVKTSLDTLRPVQDTVGIQAVAAVARACGATFLRTDTASRDRNALLRLAILAQDDSMAHVLLLRGFPTGAGASADLLALTEEALPALEARPPRFAVVESLVARLEALHDPSTHFMLLKADSALLDLAWRNGDTAQSRRLAERLFALEPELPKSTLEGSMEGHGDLFEVYRKMMALAMTQGREAMARVAQRYAQDYHRAQLDPTRLQILINEVSNYVLDTTWTAPEPPLHADAWFPAVAGDTIRPVPGKVNLYVVGLPGPTVAERLHRWLAQYGAQGLVVTIVVESGGTPYNDIWVFAPSASDEEARLQWYVQTYLQLPVTVAVQRVHNTWRPMPDGRRIDTVAFAFAQRCGKYSGIDFWDHNLMVLVGREGRGSGCIPFQRTEDGYSRKLAEDFENSLRWAMAQSAVAPSSPLPPVGPTAAASGPAPLVTRPNHP